MIWFNLWLLMSLLLAFYFQWYLDKLSTDPVVLDQYKMVNPNQDIESILEQYNEDSTFRIGLLLIMSLFFPVLLIYSFINGSKNS